MGKYKCKLKKRVHRRGGVCSLTLNNKVTNWGGMVLKRECLKEVMVGDFVRVRISLGNEDWVNRYVRISKVVSKDYFKGYVSDPYIREERARCNKCLNHIEIKELYACGGEFYNACDFHVHLKCCREVKCDCGKDLGLVEVKYPNNTTIIFKRNNIMEIPDWSKNTMYFKEIFGTGRGYIVTGIN